MASPAALLTRAGAVRALDAAWGPRRLTVLAYHRILEWPDPAFAFAPELISATPAAFAHQMDWVARRFEVVGLDDVLAFVDGERPLPPRPLLVTFDDGYRDVADHALPVLRARGLPAVVFVVTGAVGRSPLMWWDECSHLFHAAPARAVRLPSGARADLGDGGLRERLRAAAVQELKMMDAPGRTAALTALRDALGVQSAPTPPSFVDWADLAEMAAAGVACQPHTETHPILARIPIGEARREIAASAREVAGRTGRPSVALAYPNGERGDYDGAVIAALRGAGIRMAFTMRPGPASPAAARRSPHEIPRIGVGRWDDMRSFALKVMGLARVMRPARDALRAARARQAASSTVW
jgi:peptidoglycan/xylan/chitin deacetylase (PgdA/CDA1 family)